MRRNLLFVLLLLAASGVAARYRPDQASQERRLEDGLCALWGTPNNDVEIQPNGDLWATVFRPPGSSRGSDSWSFQLVRWLAARDPKIPVKQLRVTDGNGSGRLREDAPPVRQGKLQAVADGLMGHQQTLVLLEREQPSEGALRGQGCVVVIGDAPAELVGRVSAGHPELHLRLVKVPKP